MISREEAYAQICAEHHVTPSEVHIGGGRSLRIAKARGALVRLLRSHGWSTTEIAAAIGYRDHTTVLYHLEGK